MKQDYIILRMVNLELNKALKREFYWVKERRFVMLNNYNILTEEDVIKVIELANSCKDTQNFNGTLIQKKI